MEERDLPRFCKISIMHSMGVIGLFQLIFQTMTIYYFSTAIWIIIAAAMSFGMLIMIYMLFNKFNMSNLHLYVLFSVFYSVYLIISVLFVFLNNYNLLTCTSTTYAPSYTSTVGTSAPTTYTSSYTSTVGSSSSTTTSATITSPCEEQSNYLLFIIISTINIFLTFIQLRFSSAVRHFLKTREQPPRARIPVINRNFPPRYSQCSMSNQTLPGLGKPPSYSLSVEVLDVTTLEESPNLQPNDLPPAYDNVVMNEQNNNSNEN